MVFANPCLHYVLCVYSDFGWGYRMLMCLKRRFPNYLFRLQPFYATDMWRLECYHNDRFGRLVNPQRVGESFQSLCVESN